MMCRDTRFVLSLLLLLLAACTTSCQSTPDDSDSPPILPNLLVKVTGQVEVRREGSSRFVPVALGAMVQPGDTLRLLSGEASIFCGDEALWDASPQSLPLDEQKGVPCQEGRPPRSAPELSFLRGEEDSVSDNMPYVLSPRSGFVLNDRPTLRWHPLSDGEPYTITLLSDDGQARPPVSVSGGVLSYPDEWPPLEANGASYRLRVYGEGQRQGGGFSLLDQSKAEQVRDQAERLRQRLSEGNLSLTLLLAELYLNNKLRSEAVELLLKADGNQVVAVQRLLGETYFEMRLLDEATAAYSQALTLALLAELPEEQATAHLHLGLLACARTDRENARTHWQEAEKLYDQIERPKDEVEALLANVDHRCIR